jgi:fructose-bisphosphate aldolase class 1
MEAQENMGTTTASNQPELLILGDPVLIPSVHKIQQQNNLNEKEQARSELGYRFCKSRIVVRIPNTINTDDGIPNKLHDGQ